MVKLATSLQHQVRYDYNRSSAAELRPVTISPPRHGLMAAPSPTPTRVPSAAFVRHITLAWDSMQRQASVQHRLQLQ